MNGNATYLISYERQDTMFKLYLGLRIFLQPLLLVLFLILAAPISISLAKWNKWGAYFAPDQYSLAITSCLPMLGILA